MSIVFYQAPMSSATPVAWALAELGVAHERVTVDLARGDQRKPAFLALNPNGKVPTLVVGGVPMFEALAIMLHLADRFGVERKLWPALDDPARPTAMAWSVWAYVTYGTALRQLFLATSERLGERFHNAAQADYARNELDNLLGMLDAKLASAPYLLGASFSIADVVVGSVVHYSEHTGVAVARHANVGAWLERCQARPGFQKLRA